MKTTLAKTDDPRAWYIIDASQHTLGRLAVVVANILRGRHKPTYTPSVAGDFVIVVNAAKVKVTGRKETQKEYMSYSGYVGGEKYTKLSTYRQKNPAFLIEHAVKGMLNKNKLANVAMKHLKVYAGAEHPHVSQRPVAVKSNISKAA